MKDKILEALKNVKYPGFDSDIVTLGMVEEFTVEGDLIRVKMKQLQASDEVKQTISGNIEDALVAFNLKTEVEFPSAPQRPQGEPGLPPKKEIPGVKRILPIASGKGGVGKSTVSVNIALALVKEGKSVGLLDLDIYGPSIPTMLGIKDEKPMAEDGKLVPIEISGLQALSLGLLIEQGQAAIWRGPMVAKVVKQFFYDIAWHDLDYLILDLPPGTGDVQLTMVQSVPIFGAIVVTTPQNVALADVEKAIDMFNKTDAPVIGIVENMSGFLCPHCGEESHIFGQGGGRKEAEKRGVPLLGQIPLEAKITETGDSGRPIVLADGKIADIFQGIAREIIKAD